MKIHFIGICGVAMGGLALALKKAGHEVTGSDKGFFPPISTYLKDNNVPYYPGWHPTKMCANGNPDLVVVGNVASSTNPEWIYVQENNIPYVSYPELIKKFFLKENSIVCSGTYGKTSSAALLSQILTDAEYNPSYMFGGLSIDETPSAVIGSGVWNVLEGDEYKTARWDNSPKFAHYDPTHLLLTAVEWDHADIYPTEEKYAETFETLVQSLPKDGLLVVSERAHTYAEHATCKIVSYGLSEHNDYTYSNLVSNKNGIEFDIAHDNKTYHIHSPFISEYQAENITGSFALAHSIGIEPDSIIKSIASHQGLRRRMEKRLDGDVTVIDDIAHSPAKASSALSTVRKITKGNVIALFEPNTGNRQPSAAKGYDHAFKDADMVIIPRLTIIKTDKDADKPFDGIELASVISNTHTNTQYIEDDAVLIETLVTKAKKGDSIVFLGSHGFRGMIEELINKLQ
ncbi:MAG: hypothetical protein KBD29_03225 [Candidatus Magasanikbacteria bacterium]|nr:hypothetical protein [Candidatus Magasanikbacteria bacterium]